MGIESVVDENAGKSSSGVGDAMCTACEMAVVWMQNQLRKNETEDQIIDYVNQVTPSLYLAAVASKEKGKTEIAYQLNFDGFMP